MQQATRASRRKKGNKAAFQLPWQREPRRKRTPEERKAEFRESVRFWFWAIIITLILRAFIIEPYRIPTPSMEETLLVGDFLFVSKLHYGPRTPNTLGVPFTGVYLRGLEFPQARIPGFGSVGRGDVAVFNHPPEAGPIERRTPYIKRLVGLPGDKVLILDKVLYVNDERYPLTAEQMQRWRVEPEEDQPLSASMIRGMGIDLVGQVREPRPAYVVNATPVGREGLLAHPAIGLVEPFVEPENLRHPGIFPPGAGYNADHYGPLAVPRSGDTVELNEQTWAAYRSVITRYEGRAAEQRPDGTFVIDGETVTSYTFEQDYYFALGDNRDNSEDSRFWGFVPHDHLVGKAVMVFFSLDFENRWLGFVPAPRLRGLRPIR